MSLTCNVNEIIKFFEEVSDRDTFHIARMDSRKERAYPRCFTSPDIPELLDWIVEYNERKNNIYEQFNPPKRKSNQKAKRKDIVWIFGFHLDWDIPKDCEDREAWLAKAVDAVNKLKGVKGKPHIVMTGNGIQCRWPLHEPIRATDETLRRTEDVNARIAATLKADYCHNADRLLRIPGTVNWGSPKKVGMGYPYMAELWQVTKDTFDVDDFKKLAKAPRQTEYVDETFCKDYTAEEYSPDYDEPVSWSELVEYNPLIEQLTEETLHNGPSGYDRSRAAWFFIMQCIEAIGEVLELAPREMIDNPDIYKNIAELCMDSDNDFLAHYEEHPRQFGRLGQDIRTCLLGACDDAPRAEQKKKEAEKRRTSEKALATPFERLSVLEHRREFINHVEACIQSDDLPNVTRTANRVAGPRQQATESNIRAILDRAGVIVRWDVMRDEIYFDVLERAGRVYKGEDTELAEKRVMAPRHHFHGALAKVSPDMRAAAATSLLADALHEKGIVARLDIGKLLEIIAKEDRFHPIEAYCKSKAWDGKRRIHKVAACLETDHPLRDEYIHIVFRQCVAAIKSLEAYKRHGTGEMLGSVVVLVGRQRMKKSSFWEKLAPKGFMSTGTKLALGTNKEADSLRSCLNGLLTNLDEIGAAMDFSQAENFKNFITNRIDDFRVAYGHFATIKPRMTCFVGTSNELHLKDATGSRRFLAMSLTDIDFDTLNSLLADPEFLQQCYAEAWHDVMEDGATWWLDDEQDNVRAEENAAHEDQSEEEAALEAYLNVAQGDRYETEWMTLSDIFRLLGLKYTPAKMRRAHAYLTDVEGVIYKAKYKERGGITMHKVYAFPASTEMIQRLKRL